MPTATLTSQLDRGVGVGIRHLIHSLSPSTSAGQVGGSSPPRAGRMETPDDPLSGGAPGLSITPRSPFLGKCISYSVCNVDPSPGVWGRRWVRWGGGWPSVPPGGAGGNCIETSLPRQTGVGLPVPSQPSTCTLWGRERCCDGPRDTPENRSATCPCPLAMPRVSHHLLLPLSPPCPPPPASAAPAFLLGNNNTRVGSLASILAVETKGTRGRGGLAGRPAPWGLGTGIRLRSPGPGGGGGGHLPFQSSSER